MKKVLKKYWGALLGLISVLLFQVFKSNPNFVENFYTLGVYKFLRICYSYTLFYFPFPLFYLFVIGLFVLVLGYLLFFKKKKLRHILNFMGLVLFAFYFLWGFNYARNGFVERAEIKVEDPSPEFLFEELEYVDSILIVLRDQLESNDTIAVAPDRLAPDYQDNISYVQDEVLNVLKEPIFPGIKIWSLQPKGILLRLKTAGVYFPFVLEGHIDDGLHHLEKPYVMAHERAHAQAFTDEGVCNFIGWLTCIHSKDPFIAYSGWLAYHGYLYRALKRYYPEKLANYALPKGMAADLKDIRKRLDKYPSIGERWRDLFYNNYLKAQGISAGMKSYAQITQLALSLKAGKGTYYLFPVGE